MWVEGEVTNCNDCVTSVGSRENCPVGGQAAVEKELTERMKIYRGTTGFWVQGAAVELLRAVYLWIGRHYHRELLRRELWRIGRQAAVSQRHRGPSCGSGLSVRHGQTLTPG